MHWRKARRTANGNIFYTVVLVLMALRFHT
jgi:hypothetical protein